MKKKELKNRVKELEEDIRCFRSSNYTDRLRVELKYDVIDKTDKLIWSEEFTKHCNYDGFMPLIRIYEKEDR